MNLFDSTNISGFHRSENLLPYDGEVYYYGTVFDQSQAHEYLQKLLGTIEWKNDQLILFGKNIQTQRKVAWYADKPFEYSYSNSTKQASYWNSDLLEIKEKVEILTNKKFNSCLLNLYHSGDEGMSWHSDNENSLEKYGCIASVSLGAERNFKFRHIKSKSTINVSLENGSILTMMGEVQAFWHHSLPKTKKIHKPRINLTFRNFIG